MKSILYKGQTYNLSALARHLGMSNRTLDYRLSQGYTLDEIASVGSGHIKMTTMGRRSKNNKLSADQAERLIKAKAAGATYEELAERFGICRMTVYRTLKKVKEANA